VIVGVLVFLFLYSRRSRGESLNHYSDEMETVENEFDPEVMPMPTTSPVLSATNPEDVDLHGFTFYADEGIGVD
jgi:hypothetical protein